ncbi:hypothetical protein ANTQUA_LOCUS3894 [Anthophora quadrimaculata]
MCSFSYSERVEMMLNFGECKKNIPNDIKREILAGAHKEGYLFSPLKIKPPRIPILRDFVPLPGPAPECRCVRAAHAALRVSRSRTHTPNRIRPLFSFFLSFSLVV